jgi:hypothetical protein
MFCRVRFTVERVGSRCEILQPFRQISHMSTLLSGVMFGEINWPIFPRRQFLIEGVVKAFIWINTECLIIKVENQVTTIPNGRVPSESYYSPRPRHAEFHVMPNWPSHLFVVLRLRQGRTSNFDQQRRDRR